MLAVLLESRAARPRHTGSTALSALAHGTAIAVAVALTLPGRAIVRPAPEVHSTTVTFVRPTTTAAPPARSPVVPHTSVPRPNLPVIVQPTITPMGIPPIDLAVPGPVAEQIIIGSHSDAPGTRIAGSGTTLGSTVDVSDVSDVDRAPRLVGRAIQPLYPSILRAAGIEGRVVAEFVVDTLGRAELGTLRFPELANPLFGDAVRAALARYRFAPGEVAGRKVRTRVALPFDFRVVR